MARLRNAATGVVVEVRDEKVALLGSGWEDTTSEKSTPQRRTKKADEKPADK